MTPRIENVQSVITPRTLKNEPKTITTKKLWTRLHMLKQDIKMFFKFIVICNLLIIRRGKRVKNNIIDIELETNNTRSKISTVSIKNIIIIIQENHHLNNKYKLRKNKKQ